MAGRPKLRALKRQVEMLGGVDVLVERIASGETISSIARELGVPRVRLSKYLHSDPEISRRVSEAHRQAAEALVEQSLELADQATPEDYRVRQLQIDTRRWVVQQLDPERFGPRPAAQLQIHAGALHVAVLQALEGRGPALVSPALPSAEGREEGAQLEGAGQGLGGE